MSGKSSRSLPIRGFSRKGSFGIPSPISEQCQWSGCERVLWKGKKMRAGFLYIFCIHIFNEASILAYLPELCENQI